MAADTSALIGSGWAFPAGVNSRGRIALVAGEIEIESAVAMILSTAPGERVLRPDFGCAIWDRLFDPIEPTTLALMAEDVADALQMWEPRIDVTDIRCITDGNRVDINVQYVIRATSDPRSLVHPFYLIPSEELSP